MSNRKNTPRTPTPQLAVQSQQTKGILELDRFTEASIDKWNDASADIDELNAVLYFNLEPERRRKRAELIAALKSSAPIEYHLKNWVRIVDYQWTNYPLSAAGSLCFLGGRFNTGRDLDRGTLDPWPALYLAQDYATAYREKFQLQIDESVNGLTPEELSLSAGKSHSTVVLNGKLTKVFEMSQEALGPVAKILGRVKMPARAEQIKRKLKIKPQDLRMITTSKQLFVIASVHNWRTLPVQFGLPAPSQILAELIRAADFEAIAYPSTKGGGTCLAVFVDRLAHDSYIELSDKAPKGVTVRLDTVTADELAGWAQVGLAPQKN